MSKRKLFTGKIFEFRLFPLFNIIYNPLFYVFLGVLFLFVSFFDPTRFSLPVVKTGNDVFSILFIFVGILICSFMISILYFESSFYDYTKSSHYLKSVPDSVFDLINCLLIMDYMQNGKNYYCCDLTDLRYLLHSMLYNGKPRPDNSILILAVQKLKSIDSNFKNDKIYKEIAQKRDYKLKNLNKLIPLAINIVNNDKILKYPDLYEDTHKELEDTVDFMFRLVKYYKRELNNMEKDKAQGELKKLEIQSENF